jgi:Domain of unknown function (DUF4833)
MSKSQRTLAGVVFVAAALGSASVAAAAVPAGEITSAFSIAKSSNRNQVHYAVEVDGACAPTGAAPVKPYWRMLERSPDATEPLLDREQRAYGIASQAVEGSQVRLVLRALPDRPVTIRTARAADGTCAATSTMAIGSSTLRLYDIYVKQSLFGVDYILLTGWSDSGAVVREKLNL